MTIVVGELSYRLLEAPVLRRGGRRAVTVTAARVEPAAATA
jgi:peptidoglycan/LPS O-acetylase OafA/YrhL